jgi:DNA-binding NarL/FixJ family response regulator
MSIRILITDDHAAVRQMLKLLVETHPGWEVCGEAENGREAVAKARELKPDLIIMDMAMPVMDGIRASREISTGMPNVPILMHTLHHSPQLVLEAKRVGVRRVVAKAEGGNQLLAAIGALLGENNNAATQGGQTPEAGAPVLDVAASTAQADAVETSSSAEAGDEDLPQPH